MKKKVEKYAFYVNKDNYFVIILKNWILEYNHIFLSLFSIFYRTYTRVEYTYFRKATVSFWQRAR